jgi:GNAT superfamily N-acetyltransferase
MVHVSDAGLGVVSLDLIAVPADLRGRGCARQALSEVAAWADEVGAVVLLSATSMLGANITRLVGLYGEYGFTATGHDGIDGIAMRRPPAPR